ncbi:SigE family RNA polymerase sigma factor [Rhizohabitans arisaemae]|uniref:SigE family RNA polymerase sigma factor n=1 Tax=Rhizohabitans arisaemae TaxID=2720610 RepID=UPI0024B25511|nr:SigE family RNA polymerase sigma factor [Rhizohabitans arisaemae]
MSDDGHEEFRQYVVARGPTLLRAAYTLTGNRADAEDLLQAALTKTYLAWEGIQERAALDGYVRRAMVNIQISWWRRRRLREHLFDEVPEPSVAPEPDGDLHVQLQEALDRLPPRQRAVVVLRYYEDLTEPEIAKILEINVGTVKSTLSRAVAKLRGFLAGCEPYETIVPRQRQPQDDTSLSGV